jgi:hypothetical protein
MEIGAASRDSGHQLFENLIWDAYFLPYVFLRSGMVHESLHVDRKQSAECVGAGNARGHRRTEVAKSAGRDAHGFPEAIQALQGKQSLGNISV